MQYSCIAVREKKLNPESAENSPYYNNKYNWTLFYSGQYHYKNFGWV